MNCQGEEERLRSGFYEPFMSKMEYLAVTPAELGPAWEWLTFQVTPADLRLAWEWLTFEVTLGLYGNLTDSRKTYTAQTNT